MNTAHHSAPLFRISISKRDELCIFFSVCLSNKSQDTSSFRSRLKNSNVAEEK